VNGVPLRRVNQAFVIATSTKVDVSKVAVPASVNDDFFKAPKAEKAKKSEEGFFALTEKKGDTSAERKAAQTAVDAGVKLDETLTGYLKSRFSLSKGQKVHELKF
jgi:large subunit ribosomal protein L6e